MDLHSTTIEVSQDHKFNIWAYKWSNTKRAFTWTLILLTCGLFRLILYWRPPWFVKFMCDKCSLKEAELILICDDHHVWTTRTVLLLEGDKNGLSLRNTEGKFAKISSVKYFTFRKLKYLWQPSLNTFAAVFSLDVDVTCSAFHQWAAEDGLSTAEALSRQIVYGLNVIAVQLKPIAVLLFREVISPFYVFQIYSVTLWYNDTYYYYASVVVLLSVFSIGLDVYQTRSQEKSIRDMVHSIDSVTVVRDGEPEHLCSDTLVPGDLIHIPPHGCIMQCDAVLLNGTCIVNESMLTGESVPVTKTALPQPDPDLSDDQDLLYSTKEHSKHTLFCGTKVLQTRFYSGQPVKAIVIRTGYNTVKGGLVRSIMYPKPIDFEFTKDLFKFIGFMTFIAFFGFIYTIVIMIQRGAGVRKLLLRSLDIITIVVPPALPAAMTIGIMAAQMRLKRRKIFCISPSTINTCGGINMVCFDKTGTLTEDGLDFNCAIPIRNQTFEEEKTQLNETDDLTRALATCQSVTMIEGELCGDPLDLILLKQTGWKVEEPSLLDETGRFDSLVPTVVKDPFGNLELGIIRQFTFSSNLQRMSVIVRQIDQHDMMLYCKGAPEKVSSLCLPYTIPSNFLSIVEDYASGGDRLIAVAKRAIKMSYVKAQRVAREMVERDLELIGLVVLENRLKPQTTPVIGQLTEANIRTVMVTGDNLQTAITVAKECGILTKKPVYSLDAPMEGSDESELSKNTRLLSLRRQRLSTRAQSFGESGTGDFLRNFSVEKGGEGEPSYHLTCTGTTFGAILRDYPSLVPHLVSVCSVFARMSPEQKAQLINAAQELEYTVAMCGDGANDCGALKAAHAGISLSEAEASIASPFTSQIPDIRCVPAVISEGRAALVTSFGIFKYMAGYSMTQFISVLLLYWLATNLADFQFLYIDFFLITTFAVLFGYTAAANDLAPTPPAVRILSVPSVLSISVQIILMAAFQLFIFNFTSQQPWFVPYTDPGDTDYNFSYQGTAIFFLSLYQYTTLAVVYSKGKPYRSPIWNNKGLCISLVFCTSVCIWLTLYPPEFLVPFMNFLMAPVFKFRLLILFLAFLCAFISFLCEKWIIDFILLDFGRRKGWKGLKPRKAKYEIMLEEVGDGLGWLKSYLRRAQGTNASRLQVLEERRNSYKEEEIVLTVNDKKLKTVTEF